MIKNKIQILIVEDEPIIAADLQRNLTKLGYEVIGRVASGEDSLVVLADTKPDIILMDIQLKGNLDGIETADQIEKLYQIPLIFVTSNSDKKTLDRAMSVKPRAFLSKPFRISDIASAIELAVFGQGVDESSTPEEDDITIVLNDRIFIREKTFLYKLLIDDMIYIEADGSYCIVHTADRTYTLSYNLNKFFTSVAHENLLRVHRSYIINLRHIDRIAQDHLLVNDNKIPIGKAYREELNKRIRAF